MLTSVRAQSSAGEVENKYYYDSADRLNKITHNGFDYTFARDGYGNTTIINAGSRNLIKNIFYSGNGNLWHSDYGNGFELFYEYDAYDRVKSVKKNNLLAYEYLYDAKPWRDLVLQKIDVIAKASNIPVSDLHWYAGMHNTTHHPHIHLSVFTDDPKVGHLNVTGINEMKSAFSEVIFADERRHIYEHKTEIRDSLKQEIDDILSDIRNGSSDQLNRKQKDSLCEKLLHLGDQLKDRPGRPQYGRIKDLDIRREIKDIMFGLAEAPAIRQLYELLQRLSQGMYVEDLCEEMREQLRRPYEISILKSVEKNWNDDLRNKKI